MVSGQCQFIAEEGSVFCARHCGQDMQDKRNREEVRNYQLSKFRAEVMSKADNPKVKSLREEVGMLREMIQMIWNQCRDADDIVMRSGKIADLITKLDKLVSSCHRLEAATGQLLDRQVALTFADKVVQIIQVNVNDPVILANISDQVTLALAQSTDPTCALVEQTFGPKQDLDVDNDD
jgi:hypothetical protein